MKKNSDFSVLNLGDLVEFKAKEKEHGFNTVKIVRGNNTTVYKSGHTKMVSPTMIVIEIVHEKRPKDSKSKKTPIKILCQWFSHQTNSFIDRWFNIGVLRKIKDVDFKPSKFALDQVVTLKSIITRNLQSERVLEHVLESEREIDKTEYRLSQTYDTLSFFPPKMVVTGFAINDKSHSSVDKVSGLPKRYVSKELIKCMWYDYSKGKFSEHQFISEALVGVDNLSIQFPWEEEPLPRRK